MEDCVTRTHRLGLSSGASPVIIRLDVVPLHPRSSTVSGCQLGGYPAGRDLWGGTNVAGGMSEDHDRCFSMLVLGAFSTGVFLTPMHYPALTLAPTCGASRASSQVFINAGARLLYTSDGVCVIVYVLLLVCRGRYGLGGMFLLFIIEEKGSARASVQGR